MSMSVFRGWILWRFSLSKNNISPAASDLELILFPLWYWPIMNAYTKQQQDKVFQTDFIDSQKYDPPFAHLLALSHFIRVYQLIKSQLSHFVSFLSFFLSFFSPSFFFFFFFFCNVSNSVVTLWQYWHNNYCIQTTHILITIGWQLKVCWQWHFDSWRSVDNDTLTAEGL